MPILRKETDIFPENLFDLPATDAPWEIAHLRSRQEKAAARLLLEAGMPFYLPQVDQTHTSAGRTFVSYLPLFPGYIFVRAVDGLRQTLWRTRAVAHMIEVADQEQLAAELLQIRQLQASGAVLTPHADPPPGDSVRMAEGAFTGGMDVVMEERGLPRQIVSVSVLRQSVAVEFPRAMVTQMKPDKGGHDRRTV